MPKTLYLIRHCQSSSQLPDAPLTDVGHAQAIALADLMAHLPIDRIISSPYLRAQQTAQPLADRLNLPVELDERFGERILSGTDRPDWFEQLRTSFNEYDLCLPGGESNRTVQARGVAALQDALEHPSQTTAIVNHGTIMTLMLNYFDSRFGFAEWQKLTNPDLYKIEIGAGSTTVERVDGVDAVST